MYDIMGTEMQTLSAYSGCIFSPHDTTRRRIPMIKNITDLETQDIIRKFQKENYSYSECTLYEYEMKEMIPL